MNPTQASSHTPGIPEPAPASVPALPRSTRRRTNASPPGMADLWATIEAGRWFHALPAELAGQLKALAQPRALGAGDWLFRRGDPACGLYAVARGALSISGTAACGEQARTALLALVEPPMWLGEIALLDGAQRTHDAQAATASIVLHVPQAPLRDWLAAHPAHWQPLALLLTDKLRICLEALEEQTLLPAPQRLARRLVRMAEGFDQWQPDGQGRQRWRRELDVSQEQLARMLGLSRQTTNQILQELQQAGCLQLRRGKLEVLDRQGLRDAGWITD
ncbi:Crp/Fnr family transcriptional regulator [Delftia tsuruhatensis]|uniref:Crp/Fnr family transcriptional regulator n=1 Tax=Delftia tsuruhatensis TaxID=180282 RepID=UPI001F2A3A95|nr:Crp/Fnr family transcriptional regulator [Delftia tsuruhatensis]